MALNRRALLAAAGATAITAALASCAREETSTNDSIMTVAPSTLERVEGPGAPFVPTGGYPGIVAEADYVEEEYFASGTDNNGQPYKTQIYVRKPRDASKFTGTVIVEPLHAASAAPMFIYTGRYIMRSGHGWACVGSQKGPVDSAVKPFNPERYASLNIAGAEVPAAPPAANAPPGAPSAPAATPEEQEARRVAMEANAATSSALLAQAGAALRGAGNPFGDVRHIFLVGHSQTGGVVTNYVRSAHDTQRLDGGGPIYDGLMPTGAARDFAFGPRDVPLLQLVSEGDIDLPERSNGRAYRRDDSDEANDRYRLYELAGAPHMGTRYAPYSNPNTWVQQTNGGIKPTDKMNSYPHHEMFCMAMNHLVKWVGEGAAPPRADRIEAGADGVFVKDANGNSRGGVRCAQVDVPHSTYHPDPEGAQAVVGTETVFPAAKMRELYQTRANYTQRFNARLDELIGQGWFLTDDAQGMRDEAAAQRF